MSVLRFMLSLTVACGLCVSLEAQVVSASRDAETLDIPKEVRPFEEGAREKWEKDISKWEQLDQSTDDPDDAILLIGSSSIRRWDSAAEDLAPYPVIGRGYGGARFTDLAVFAERLIHPHQYRAVVIFVANDVTGKSSDRPMEAVQAAVKHIVRVAQDHQPESPVVLVEITPTSSRRNGWPKIRQVNAFLREFSLTKANVSFVSTAEWYLDSDDQVRDEYFVSDKLHLNERGYDVWGSLIKRELDRVLDQHQK